MMGLCAAEGIGVIPWSPLARGRLTRAWDDTTERSQTDAFGKTLYNAAVDADKQIVDRVAQVAAKHSVPRAQVALAWMLTKPVITAPIVGASKPHHLEDAVNALTVKLSDEDIAALEEPYVPHPVAGFS
jgi:aryl-alcohol dehydrogenase-like predicted oxidoreductase